ncbi:hypothetical protein AWM68_17385 [Fictibacillus phosphorivorans]|uniref:DnaA N-terminal domain-containing protein n=1 Tax=Fictibacillus phosphorivorans TaxID=1221500 RepID=A0A165NWD4_9BACL|nr:hypothetical protein [Fictibacillus phosphorivorans]KZE67945.1 hypothetical protein AWM68_17385 [Fictibacillus phosphorivorans]
MTKFTYYRYTKEIADSKPVTRKRKVKNPTTGELEYVLQTYERKIKKTLEFSEEDVKKFTLENTGQLLPATQIGHTQMNNYFLDFWGAILGHGPVAVFTHLLRHAYQKDWCDPSLELIEQKMDIKRDALNGYLDILENHGFIFRFWRKKKDDKDKDTSIFFKLRRTIPLLTESLLLSLKENKPKLYTKHNEYLEQLNESHEVELNAKDEYEAIYKDFEQRGIPMKTQALKKAEKDAETFDDLFNLRIEQVETSEDENNLWITINNHLQERISKPSYEMYFKGSKLKFEGMYAVIYIRHEFMQQSFEDIVRTLIGPFINNEFDEMVYEIFFQPVIRLGDMK